MHRVPRGARPILCVLIVVLPVTSMACNSTGRAPTVASPAASADPAQTSQPTVPAGWMISKDPSGRCEASAPPEWKLGADFFLAANSPEPGPFENTTASLPPSGLALWGIGEGTPVPEGHRYQIRDSLVIGEMVCSVWRIRADADFSAEERSQLQQVGQTLRAVQP